MNAPLPSVSDGAGEDRFVQSVVEASKDLKASGIGTVTILWKGEYLSTTLSPADIIPHSERDGRVRGKARAFLAAYIVWLKGNTCHINDTVFCLMKGRPFESPVHADFDHIDNDYDNFRVDNFQLACAPCNRHKQAQFSGNRAVPVAYSKRQERENVARARAVQATSGELAQSREQYPRAVKDAFHPLTGRLAKIGQSVNRRWYVNNLPEFCGLGRATTFGKYVDEWVEQGYLEEEPDTKGVKLVRTGKAADGLLYRELGIKTKDEPGTLGGISLMNNRKDF